MLRIYIHLNTIFIFSIKKNIKKFFEKNIEKKKKCGLLIVVIL